MLHAQPPFPAFSFTCQRLYLRFVSCFNKTYILIMIIIRLNLLIVAIFTIFLIGLLFLNYFPHPQLLTIFVSGKLNQYQQFYKNNKDFITSLGKSEKPWALKFVFGIGILLLKKKK